MAASSSKSSSEIQAEGPGGPRGEVDPAEYLPLYRAITENNWETAKEIFKNDPKTLTAKIATDGKMPLHVAIQKVENIEFLKKLLTLMKREILPIQLNNDRRNPLHLAAVIGNKAGAEKLVNLYPNYLFITDGKGDLPIHIAVANSHRATFEYLLQECKKYFELSTMVGHESPFEGIKGAHMLMNAIDSGFLDVAHNLIIDYPDLAKTLDGENRSPLSFIGAKSDAYYSGAKYDFLQRRVYPWLQIDNNHSRDTGKKQDSENKTTSDEQDFENRTTSDANASEQEDKYVEIPEPKQEESGANDKKIYLCCGPPIDNHPPDTESNQDFESKTTSDSQDFKNETKNAANASEPQEIYEEIPKQKQEKSGTNDRKICLCSCK